MRASFIVLGLFNTVTSLSVRSINTVDNALTSIEQINISNFSDQWRIEFAYNDHEVVLNLDEVYRVNNSISTEGDCHYSNKSEWESCGKARFAIQLGTDEVTAQGMFQLNGTTRHLFKDGVYMVMDEGNLERDNTVEEPLSLFKRGMSDAPNSNSDDWPHYNDLKEIVANGTTCYSELRQAPIGIVADINFINSFSSLDAAQLHIIDTVNKASQVWENAFNISLVLTEMIMGGPGTQYSWNIPCNQSDNTVSALETRLSALKNWREQIHTNDGMALWSIFSNCPSSDVIGLAWQSTACQTNGVNILHHSVLDYQILAHESGHVFGAVHDCVNTTCNAQSNDGGVVCCPYSPNECDSNGRYIMSPGSEIFQQSFSKCTQANVCSAIFNNHINSTCLVKRNTNAKPVQSVTKCNQADPVAYRKCWRDLQCQEVSNSPSAVSCGSVYDCTLSCQNPNTKKCVFYNVPLVYQAVWGMNNGIRNNSCTYPYTPGQSTMRLYRIPVWGWALIGVIACVILIALALITMLIISRIRKKKKESEKPIVRRSTPSIHRRSRLSKHLNQIRVGFPSPHRKVINREPITGIKPMVPYNTSPQSPIYHSVRTSSLERSLSDSTSSSMYSTTTEEKGVPIYKHI